MEMALGKTLPQEKKYRCAVQGAKSLVPVSSPNVGSNARICLPVKA